jgi:hypothetical protein
MARLTTPEKREEATFGSTWAAGESGKAPEVIMGALPSVSRAAGDADALPIAPIARTTPSSFLIAVLLKIAFSLDGNVLDKATLPSRNHA